MTPSPAPPAVPITHQSHPLWQGFSWDKLLHVLQVAATVAPVIVAIADSGDPNAVLISKQLGDVTNVVIGKLAVDNSDLHN